MTQAAPAGNGPGRPGRPVGGVLGGIAFALTPWLSLGFGTPVAFILAAALFSYLGKVHAVVLWLSAAVYTAALIVELAESDAAPGTTGDHLFIAGVVITMVVGGLQAVAFTVVARVRGYRPVWGKTTQDATPEAEPAVRTSAPPQPPAPPAPAPQPQPPAPPARVVVTNIPPPVGPNQGTLGRGGQATLIAGLVCLALSLALFVVPVLLAQRAEASHPGSGEGYGFIAVFSIFPCIAAVVLLVVAIAQLSTRAPK